ncbi:Phospholipase C, partial [Ascosphaera aggregata]
MSLSSGHGRSSVVEYASDDRLSPLDDGRRQHDCLAPTAVAGTSHRDDSFGRPTVGYSATENQRTQVTSLASITKDEYHTSKHLPVFNDFGSSGNRSLLHKTSTMPVEPLQPVAKPPSPPPPLLQPAIVNDASVGAKASGLMRRFSRGAASKFSRKKQSALLDEGSGPVIIRRRSDSKNSSPGNDIFFDTESEDNDELFNSAIDGSAHASVRKFSGGIAPKVDMLLQRGCILTKVSKQRKKLKTFYLDVDAAKISWDLSNPAKRIYIDHIMGIHVGEDARNYREEQQVPAHYESRWFSIIFACPEQSIPVKMIHLIAPDEYTFKLWTVTLDEISRYRIGLMAGLAGSGQPEAILKTYWDREVARQNRRTPPTSSPTTSFSPSEGALLSLPAFEALCKSLHINCSKSALRAEFVNSDRQQIRRINFHQFQEVLKNLKDRKDLRMLFQNIASDPSQGLALDEFLQFVRDVQCEDVCENVDRWVYIFEKFVRRSLKGPPSPTTKTDHCRHLRMSYDAFSSFLMSSSNSIYPPATEAPKFDRPLNEYFISSSHNTYLLGRQVAGSSSTEAYIGALQKGCRCIEIDCWDGPDGRPN